MVGRRTVPQVFVRGKHLGGSDGMSCSGTQISYRLTAMISMNSPSILTCTYWFLYWKNADTVDAYESGKLAKLLNIAVKDDL
jgi:glutaredoxin 3